MSLLGTRPDIDVERIRAALAAVHDPNSAARSPSSACWATSTGGAAGSASRCG